ncbi:helix-turn-helix transcriptional regulator [Streptomyces blastmyceticus]|uniref:Helix-turn-helix transcriptional regulator n=1 Tax=Streptomyces blastmyceticus TaxID=68180 RepID=A0ABN0WCH8_9ACTN
MPAPKTSSFQQAREAIAARLRDLRLDAELTGRELAERCGWSESKSSRIENAKTPPSASDIRKWCSACGADDQASDLIVANRTADSMYVQWKRLHRTGIRRHQESAVPLYEQTRQFRVYCSNVIPGLVQTEAYATALLSTISDFQGTPNDAPEAAAARVERSHVIRQGRHRFALLMEEDVLYHRFGDAEVMAGQLGYLLAVMALPSVSLGVIPRGAHRRMWTLETFMIFDDHEVQIELLTAEFKVSQPGEITTYAKAFSRLSGIAVHGAAARGLITEAIGSLA